MKAAPVKFPEDRAALPREAEFTGPISSRGRGRVDNHYQY